MATSSTSYIRLGIFTIIGVGLLVGCLYFIGKEKNLFSDTFQVTGIFRDVNGLASGSNVRFGGINVGTVEDIELITDSTVRVNMIIDAQVRKFIKKDAKAVIGSEGLMGNKVIVIAPGSANNAAISNMDTISTIEPVNFDDIIANVKLTSEHAAEITENLAEMLTNVRSGKGLAGRVLFDEKFANSVTGSMNKVNASAGELQDILGATKKTFVYRKFFDKRTKEQKEADKAKEDLIKDQERAKEKLQRQVEKANNKAERVQKRTDRRAERTAKKERRAAEKDSTRKANESK
jgi:phospholipid/cholesterol/gamma-HCH transport system substrate-binding protein